MGGVPTGVSTLVAARPQGLALLVMLPSALERAALHGKTTTSVMLTFMGAPLGMFYPYASAPTPAPDRHLHPQPHPHLTCTPHLKVTLPLPRYVLHSPHPLITTHPQPIDSQQQASSSTEGDVDGRRRRQRRRRGTSAQVVEAAGSNAPASDARNEWARPTASPTDQPASPKKPLAVDSMVLMNICEEVPPESRRPSADDQPPPTPEELVLVFVRATAWFVHSVLDGAMLGCQELTDTYIATAIPVIVCCAGRCFSRGERCSTPSS